FDGPKTAPEARLGVFVAAGTCDYRAFDECGRGWDGHPVRAEGRHARVEPVIGIDLGTTNSVVATVQDGVPTVIPGRSGYKLLPSVVALAKSGKRLVGPLAKRQAVTNPENTVSGAKRLIGRKWSSAATQQARSRLPYTLLEGPHDDVRIQ